MSKEPLTLEQLDALEDIIQYKILLALGQAGFDLDKLPLGFDWQTVTDRELRYQQAHDTLTSQYMEQE